MKKLKSKEEVKKEIKLEKKFNSIEEVRYDLRKRLGKIAKKDEERIESFMEMLHNGYFNDFVDTLFGDYAIELEPFYLVRRAEYAYLNVFENSNYDLDEVFVFIDPRLKPYMKSKLGGTKIYAHYYYKKYGSNKIRKKDITKIARELGISEQKLYMEYSELRIDKHLDPKLLNILNWMFFISALESYPEYQW